MKADDPAVTKEYVLQFVSYDPETGHFYRTRRTAQRHQVGDRADWPRGNHMRVALPGCSSRAHRLAWLISTGSWPVNDIDHINGDFHDNRLCNLREATRSQNLFNKPSPVPGKKKGVGWDKERRKWVAKMKVMGKTYNLGRFDTEEEAVAVVGSFIKLHHGEFANHG